MDEDGLKIPRKLSLQSPLHPRDSFAGFFRVSFSLFLLFLWTRRPNKINRIHDRFRAVDDRDRNVITIRQDIIFTIPIEGQRAIII